ncbi:MAG TPA: helix-turn-helix domain-containing protein [Ktedonobacterales bacterium]
MTRTQPMSGGGRKRASQKDPALRRAKMALVAARERGEPDALAHALRAHPAQADALSDFSMALTATDSYNGEELTADVAEIGVAARARGLSAVFGDAQIAASAASLKALRQARGVTLSFAARALGLGVDVLSALEAGRIRVASAPRHLAEALGELLDTTADQITLALGAQMAPALRRGALDASWTGANPESSAQLDFADAVLLSQSMTAEEKARWLADSSGGRARR